MGKENPYGEKGFFRLAPVRKADGSKMNSVAANVSASRGTPEDFANLSPDQRTKWSGFEEQANKKKSSLLASQRLGGTSKLG